MLFGNGCFRITWRHLEPNERSVCCCTSKDAKIVADAVSLSLSQRHWLPVAIGVIDQRSQEVQSENNNVLVHAPKKEAVASAFSKT